MPEPLTDEELDSIEDNLRHAVGFCCGEDKGDYWDDLEKLLAEVRRLRMYGPSEEARRRNAARHKADWDLNNK